MICEPCVGRDLSRPDLANGEVKPETLVVDRVCVKILDIDVTMQVNEEDEVVNGQCGTKSWMVPEIEEKSMYSPIKAEQWLGKIFWFRKENTVLRTTARKLTTHIRAALVNASSFKAPYSIDLSIPRHL